MFCRGAQKSLTSTLVTRNSAHSSKAKLSPSKGESGRIGQGDNKKVESKIWKKKREDEDLHDEVFLSLKRLIRKRKTERGKRGEETSRAEVRGAAVSLFMKRDGARHARKKGHYYCRAIVGRSPAGWMGRSDEPSCLPPGGRFCCTVCSDHLQRAITFESSQKIRP